MDLKKRLAHLPMDRAIALAHGQDLPTEQTGTALFADISGFSALADALSQQLGTSYGAEELIHYLNVAFERLIICVHQFGGSIVNFSGDAIICWFDVERYGSLEYASRSAITVAHHMHERLRDLGTITLTDRSVIQLEMKITLATGGVHRWVLGNPEIQLIDTISGAPIDRLAMAESFAQPGSIVVDQPTLVAIAPFVHIDTIHQSTDQHEYAVVTLNQPCAAPTPWIYLTDDDLSDDIISRWLLPDVNLHFDADINNLTELRSAVALFLMFEDMNNRDLSREIRVRQFVRWAQAVIAQYGGNLLQVTFGDKGSYLYAVFGAPMSHENNTNPALAAALILRQPPLELDVRVQIGISKGMMRAGTYGSQHRHTYGVQGNDVNIAARLMTKATTGIVLVSEQVMLEGGRFFLFGEAHDVYVKGQQDPITVAPLLAKTIRSANTFAMVEVTKSKIVGRATAWFELYRGLKKGLQPDHKRLMYLYGDSGMGKTYLSAAVRKIIEPELGASWLSAKCDSILQTSLSPFVFLLQRLTAQDPSLLDRIHKELIVSIALAHNLPASHRTTIRHHLNHGYAIIELWSMGYGDAMTLQDTTDADRIQALQETLLWWIRAYSLQQPIIIHIQDSQSLDVTSRQLILDLLEHHATYPITVLLSGRFSKSGEVVRIAEHREDIDEHIIILEPLTAEETGELIQRELNAPPSSALYHYILAQAQGNPLYARLLIDHLRTNSYIQLEDRRWEFTLSFDHTDLPLGLQTKVTAHIDRLGPQSKALIQAAAVLGNSFDVRILSMMHQQPHVLDQVMTCVKKGIFLEISETRFEFANSLLRDVAYAMLGQQRLTELHHDMQTILRQVKTGTFAAVKETDAHPVLPDAPAQPM